MFQPFPNTVLPGQTRGLSSWIWPSEPSLGEMLGDPVFRQLLASDRVSMESFTDLVSVVRQRLAG